MSLPYFLTPDPLSGTLTGAEAQHAHVKRIGVGEHIMLIDGSGLTAEITVTQASKTRLDGDVVAHTRVPQPRPRLTVVQAIPKSERAELAVDLAVQAGADAIVPWISHRTIARWPENKQAKQVEKWNNQAIASAKQARRAWVPQVEDPVTTAQLVQQLAASGDQPAGDQPTGDQPAGDQSADGQTARTRALVLHEEAQRSIKDIDFEAESTTEVWLIVGPEGGIGADELAQLTDAGATPVRLGPEVMRTASAAFAALCAIGALSQRW